jgi:hypothetical protein
MWLHNELVRVPLYNEPIVIQYHGQLDIPALERTFSYIVQRHEIWRTGLDWQDGDLLQNVWHPFSVSIPFTDLRNMPPAKQNEVAVRVAQEDAAQSFDLSQPPLFRLRLFQLDDAEYRLYLIIHHIICDGVSVGQILLKELQTGYEAFASGITPQSTPLPIQYTTYAQRLKQRIRSEATRSALRHWQEKLAGPLPSTSLPLDYERSESRSYAGATIPFVLDVETTKGLKELGKRARTTWPAALLAVCHAVLFRYTGDTDQIVGTVTSDRKQPDTRWMLGLFLNTVVLRTRFDPQASFLTLLTQVRETMLDALSNDAVPFSDLVNNFEKVRHPGKTPLFQIMYAPQPYQQEQGSKWELSQMSVDTGLSKFDLHFEVEASGDQLTGRIHYSTELFKAETVMAFRNDWQLLSSEVISQPEASISDLVRGLSGPPKPQSSESESPKSEPLSFWQRLKKVGSGKGSAPAAKPKP